MGRRKERRLAAISAAGRRVKLDLFAEPSGDLGGSSTLDEVGADCDSNSHAESPTSPSSSGQKQQNPLLLLEQYSDEELDEGTDDEHDNAAMDATSVEIGNKEELATGKDLGDTESNAQSETFTEKLEEHLVDIGSASEDAVQKLGAADDSQVLDREAGKAEITTNPVLSDNQLALDTSLGWKMVLHEESNQYYYWNIKTGETSWEIPDVLAQGTVVTSVEETDDVEGRKDDMIGTNRSTSPLDTDNVPTGIIKGDPAGDCIDSIISNHGMQVVASPEGFEGEYFGDADGNKKVNLDLRTSVLGDVPADNGAQTHDVITQFGDNNIGSDLPVQLEKHCENMLERLSSVKSVTSFVDGQDLKSKFTLEVETRLDDIKALASHGTSLLPFWLHTQNRLNQLDLAIDGVLQLADSACLSEFEAILKSHEDSEDDIEKSTEETTALQSQPIDNLGKKSNFGDWDDGSNSTGQLPSMLCPSTDYDNCDGEKTGTSEIDAEIKPNSLSALQSCEEVDMDVDMEVEDTSTSAQAADYHVSTVLPTLLNTHLNQEASVSGQVFSVLPAVENWVPPPPDNEPFPPPPPDSEPIPPPPPDDEPFPPPPPDEPVESLPSYSESVQSFPYSEQYTLPYPGSSLDYYGQTHPEVSGTSFYANSGGGQVPISQPSHYYEAASNMYGITPLVVNPLGPSFYSVQNGNINPISLVNGAAVESSGTQIEPFHNSKVSDTAVSLVPQSDSLPNLSQEASLNGIDSGNGDIEGPLGVAGVHPTMVASAASLVTTNVSVPSTSSAAGPATSVATAATSKAQSKVLRGKKRPIASVSTLKSNKKVSSLVDKWKAAKEELHEEEEEPENAYEILEKKRQREIEEWRAQQIASGEAKDNANFQPLGGDWRERVKRKRAEKLKAAGQSRLDGNTGGEQQPNLVELSRDLPSGWQAYWDDSSKQVYYGNVVTSQTTWTRPAD